jgi:hypothetical protein
MVDVAAMPLGGKRRRGSCGRLQRAQSPKFERRRSYIEFLSMEFILTYLRNL